MIPTTRTTSEREFETTEESLLTKTTTTEESPGETEVTSEPVTKETVTAATTQVVTETSELPPPVPERPTSGQLHVQLDKQSKHTAKQDQSGQLINVHEQ